MATLDNTYSFAFNSNHNFRIRFTDGTNGLAGVTGNVVIQGTQYGFVTDANGFTPWFFVDPAGSLSIDITTQSFLTFDGITQSHTFVAPNQQITIALNAGIEFESSPAQPVRVINQGTGDHIGYESQLFNDMKLGVNKQVPHSFCHRRLRNRTEDITIFTNASAAVLRIRGNASNAQVGSDINMTSIGTNLFNATITWNLLNIPEGIYYVEITMTLGGETKLARSEPMDVRDRWQNLTLVEYTNYDNTKNLIFRRVPNPEYYMLISGDLLQADDEQEVNIFMDDVNDSTITYDEVLDYWKLMTLEPTPYFEVKTLQIALGFDNALINGQRYLKLGQGTRTTFGSHSLELTYEIELMIPEFDQINFFNNTGPATS